jgi:hypothetical protein
MKHYPEGDEWRDISKGHFTYGVKKIWNIYQFSSSY